jgi:hypothetical protein
MLLSIRASIRTGGDLTMTERNCNRARGFTLIELLVVIAIMRLLQNPPLALKG